MRVSFIVLQRFKRASSLCGSSFRNLTASTSTRSTTRILLWRPGNWSASESRGHNKCGPINKQIGRCILKAFSCNWTLNFRTTDNDQRTHLCEKRSETDSRFSLRNWCTHYKLSTRVNNCFLHRKYNAPAWLTFQLSKCFSQLSQKCSFLLQLLRCHQLVVDRRLLLDLLHRLLQVAGMEQTEGWAPRTPLHT